MGWYRRRQALRLIAAIVGCLAFGGLVLCSVMGLMKLLAVDVVYVVIVWVILWIVVKIRCRGAGGAV